MAKIPRSSRRVLSSGRVAGGAIPSDIADTGQGAGGLAELGKAISGGGELLAELAIRNNNAIDAESKVKAKGFLDVAGVKFIELQRQPTDTWEASFNQLYNEAEKQTQQLKFSDRARKRTQTQTEAERAIAFEKMKIQMTAKNARNAEIATGTSYETEIVNGSEAVVIGNAGLDYMDVLVANHGKDEAGIIFDKKTKTARIEKGKRAVENVNAAIEVATASPTGNFDIAREMAKDPSIPETTQTSLRSTINAAERARANQIDQAQKDLVNKTTSDTIREYFNSEVTVGTLNDRHEKGLIRDSEFKFMMAGLQEEEPVVTDPFALGRIRRANANFEAGVITRAQADLIILENYTKLIGAERANVVADLEDTATKIIGTARSNAYSEGKGLMNRLFVGIGGQQELLSLFAGSTGLTDKDKSRINRRFEAEVSNRDLYERAVDDRFREMRKDRISESAKYTSESLKILEQYQRRNRLGLEALEAEVQRETLGIIKTTTKPITKKIADMTTAEKQAELQRIRELKRLAQ